MTTVLAAVCVIGACLGIAGVVVGTRSAPPIVTVDRPLFMALSPRRTRALLAGVGACVVTLLITHWPVIALFVGVGVAVLPIMLLPATRAGSTDRIEAVATWTELLRDTLAAPAGLAQAIVVTAPVSPAPIRECVNRLAGRLSTGVNLGDALEEFADDLNDPSADVVVSALILATSARVQKLVDLLSALADSTRDEISMRLRVEASRAAARSGVRTVVVFSACFAAALVVVARAYLAPYSSATGQLVLFVVGALYCAGITLMIRLVRPPAAPRLLPARASR